MDNIAASTIFMSNIVHFSAETVMNVPQILHLAAENLPPAAMSLPR